MVACLRNNLKLVLYLLDNLSESEIHAQDNRGRNCLFYCATSGSRRLLDILLGHNLKLDVSDGGVTVLIQAVAKEQVSN